MSEPLSAIGTAAWVIDAGLRLLRASHPEEMEQHVATLREVEAQKERLFARGAVDPHAPFNIVQPSVWGGMRYVTEYPDQHAGRSSATGFPADAANYPCLNVAGHAFGSTHIITAAVVEHAPAFAGTNARVYERLRAITATRSAEMLLADESDLHAARSVLHAVVRTQIAVALVELLRSLAERGARALADGACAEAQAGVARAYIGQDLNGVVAAALLLVLEIGVTAKSLQPLEPGFDFVCGRRECSHPTCARQRALRGSPPTATLETILSMVVTHAGVGPIEAALENLFERGTALRDDLRDTDTLLAFYRGHFESLPYFTATMLAASFLCSREACAPAVRTRLTRVHHVADEFAAMARHALLIEFNLASGHTRARDYRNVIADRGERFGCDAAESLAQKWLWTDHRFPVFWERFLLGMDEAAPFGRIAGSPLVD